MIRRSRRGFAAAAATAAAGLVWATACRTPDATPVRGGTLVVAVGADVDSWNPYTTGNATAARLLEFLYPKLVWESDYREGESRFEPWLAKSWSFSPDRLSLTFRLRENARWSDGSPLTCEDVRFTLTAQTAEGLAWPGQVLKQRITGIDCPDAHSAVFRFREAYADQLLDANDDAVLPVAYRDVPFDRWRSTAWEDERRLRTAGPFRLQAVTAGQEAVLERDPHWWGTPSHLDRVVLRVHPDPANAFLQFLEGEIDVLVRVPPLRAREVEARDDLQLVELPSRRYTYLGWNVLHPRAYLEDRRRRGCERADRCEESEADVARLRRERPHPVLADARVRRALTLATDRADLVEGLWAGHAAVGGSPIVSALWAHEPATTLPFDPARARELLRAAGWTPGPEGPLRRKGVPLELHVLVNAENRLRRDALDRVAASLHRIGARVVPEPVPRGEFVDRARNKQFDAILAGWSVGTRVEPHTLFHSRAAIRRGNNLTAWATDESDALLDRAAAAVTKADAAPLWSEWQQLFRDEQPYTILFEERLLIGLHGRVRGATPSTVNPYHGLHRWWIADSGN